MVRDPDTGKYRRTRLFVLTLGYSRKAIRLLVFRSSARIWAELHERAFRRLGGTTRVVVLDYVPGNIVELISPWKKSVRRALLFRQLGGERLSRRAPSVSI